ncbi:MAG: hypothetical protein UV82_C0016G0020 [Candidatus Magasanikbacteria bacterium GW2011_GWD2_43_18]|uniref:Uncharacterized protein n=1 Tax=Candidatus Magasanikbacteria bacterium GW2011_GWE2_42_7 TaxID=1619052 RepID=A0A0G1DKA3_9BACT|nr:MAG: hypothetical protein UV18_C0004G0063 [Candidatus Magasanikbacteria bacterium GW2011_GWC2_42_27]KKS71296.1 MAG: hypothetical protein UV42_C0032G0003 [Candidatus Magasanikbacteria bacterium GW2011_GWE2_42_7]KKT03766.1 MAG: hypothetical protein UV82_C0016G0020 [Candidatus Magasanikbacteria bacterium GW2011_GWD2_43_18]HBB38415.1 hypothetical protein [Candidatus Magasanikbacteria bacterium]HCC14182.1 hypothetical protein [Candidatus Magasanikbacteria bacterium]
MQFSEERAADEYTQPSPCHVDGDEVLAAVRHSRSDAGGLQLSLSGTEPTEIHHRGHSLGEGISFPERTDRHQDAPVIPAGGQVEVGLNILGTDLLDTMHGVPLMRLPLLSNAHLGKG